MDVVLIRLVLIFLLVIYHSLCIYTGAWHLPYAHFPECDVYNWLGMLTHIFQLEGMVFISGLLFGYKMEQHPESFSFHICVINKIKRIWLPCIIFGVVYYLLFYDLSAPPLAIIYRIFNGCGHLWFLPMIFWCFVIMYVLISLIHSLHSVYYKVLIILLLVAIVNPLRFLPFGLKEVCYYFLFFYIGYCIKYNLFRNLKFENGKIALASFVFVGTFIAYMIVRDYWIFTDDIICRLFRSFLRSFLNIVSALSAIYIIYGIANKARVMNFLKSKPALITLSGYCYGVYIYQQFILQILYYKTELPYWVGAYELPWIAFVITLILSLLLCYITLKFRWGRFLIG